MVKLTMPHSNRPLSCTVTPFSSWSCCLSIPAICCTLSQIASMPISSTYSAATPSPVCNITPTLVEVDVFLSRSLRPRSNHAKVACRENRITCTEIWVYRVTKARHHEAYVTHILHFCRCLTARATLGFGLDQHALPFHFNKMYSLDV